MRVAAGSGLLHQSSITERHYSKCCRLPVTVMKWVQIALPFVTLTSFWPTLQALWLMLPYVCLILKSHNFLPLQCLIYVGVLNTKEIHNSGGDQLHFQNTSDKTGSR